MKEKTGGSGQNKYKSESSLRRTKGKEIQKEDRERWETNRESRLIISYMVSEDINTTDAYYIVTLA